MSRSGCEKLLRSINPKRFDRSSPLAQTLLGVAQNGREQIIDDPPRAGPDLDRDGHARREIDQFVVDLHLGLVERHAGRVGGLRRGAVTGTGLFWRV
jgi:hypothetical protein